MDSLEEQIFEKFLADIAFITKELSEQFLNKAFNFKRLSVINIAWCDHKIDDFTSISSDKVELKAEEPSDGTMASFR